MSVSISKNYIDLIPKALSVLVIPLLMWGIKLEVENAVRDEVIVQLKSDISELEQGYAQINEYAVKFGQVDQRLESMESTMIEIRLDIKDLLRR
jgi:hypothetical protein